MDLLSRDYPVKGICAMMGVSRAGYYKWKNREPSPRDTKREEVIALVKQVHEEHPTHYKPRRVKDRYPNLIFSTWETVDRPRQVIVSDMTAFKCWYVYFEATFYFDVFTKEILTWKTAERRGSRNQYIDGLSDVIELLKGTTEPAVLHTNQGSVYASMAYNDLIKDTNIIRSMSRAGKPTDNPVNEALNGWIKEELYAEFHLERCRYLQDFINIVERYVKYYNTQRPCFAIGYDTPENYRKRFYKGELPKYALLA